MSGDSKFFLGVVIAAVLVIGGIIIFSGNKNTDGGSADLDTSIGHKFGSDDAKVKIVEFGDFQCPACAAAASEFRKAQTDNADVQLIFRHFPLTSIHPNAVISSQAAEAAAKQNKFWEIYDLLYERQEQWSASDDPKTIFSGYAQELGLNVDQFNNDIDSDEVKAAVKRDLDYALEIDLNQTPTFFINGVKVTGVQTADEWRQLIEKAKSS